MDILLLIIGIISISLKKLHIAFICMFALLSNYFLLGSNISEIPLTHNVSDVGYVLLLILLVHGAKKKHKWKYPVRVHALCWLVYALVAFIIIKCTIEFLSGVSIINILKVYRSWLMYAFIPPLIAYYDINVPKKTINTMFYVVFYATIIRSVDYYLGTGIFSEDVLMYGDVERWPFPSEFALFYLLLTMSGYFSFSEKKKLIISIILIALYILSLTRSSFVAICVGLAIVLYKTGQLKLSKRNIGLITGLGIAFVVLVGANDAFRQRFTEGIEDVQSTSSTYKPQGNMQFRLMLLAERTAYVMSTPYKTLTGLQALPEEAFPTVFYIGLPDKERNRTIQVDTGDIAWALIVMRLGFVGGLIFCMLWFKSSRLLSHLNSRLSISGYAFLISWILLSFCAVSIISVSFWIFMFIIVKLSYSEKLIK